MKILHISDIHYRSSYDGGNIYEDMLANMSFSPFLRLQKIINAVVENNDIDVIAITGDLCDDGTAEDYKTVKDYLNSLNIPVVVTLGNHDDKKLFYRGWFQKDIDCPYMKKTEINGYSFLSFDNSEYGKANGYLDEDRLNWLKENLSSNAIVLMHHQFEDEPGIPKLEGGEQLLDVLKENPPITVLNGHTHWVKQMVLEGIPVFTAPSMCFRAINKEDGSIIFSESEGYCIYELLENKLTVLKQFEQAYEEISVWKF